MNIKHLFAFLLLSIAPLHAADISKYNVVWDSPSKDSLDSMPLSGRLGAGANVWVEAGSIWIYPSHNGAYDEVGRLLKLGCIRVTPVGLKLGQAEIGVSVHFLSYFLKPIHGKLIADGI